MCASVRKKWDCFCFKKKYEQKKYNKAISVNDKCIWLKLMIKYLWWKWDAMHETNKSRFMLTHVSRLRGWMKKNCISLRFYKVSVYHERKRFFCKNSKKNEKTANKECHKNDFRTKKYDLIGISYQKKRRSV